MSSESIAFLDLPDGRRLVGYGPFRTTNVVPDSGAAFYRNDFGLTSAAPWWIPERWEVVARQSQNPVSLSCLWEPPDASSFAAVFQEISAAIRAGKFEKTVPVVVERGVLDREPGHRFLGTGAQPERSGDGLQLHSTFSSQIFSPLEKGIFERTKDPRSSTSDPVLGYGFSDGHAGFAGASPERLLSVSHGVLKTMALAGTARTEERDVMEVDEKEIREHEYVAQSLVAKLGDIGRVRRGPRGIMELGSIIHFHTPIEVDLNREESPDVLVRRLHPTPALGPLPRTPETLEMLIGWRRRLGAPDDFGAPFGAILDGEFHAIVAIRGIWWSGRDVVLPAGCGVIEASRLVNEWRELRLKREAVKARFGF